MEGKDVEIVSKDLTIAARGLAKQLGEESAIRLIKELLEVTYPGIPMGGLTVEEAIRGLRRELHLKWVKPRKLPGGRPAKVEMFANAIKTAPSEKVRELLWAEARAELSRTSFWRLRKLLS